MGKIKKEAGSKHEATLSPAISDLVDKAPHLPLCRLPPYLAKFPRHWPFPRGDLYNWIPLLNHFDTILEKFALEYGLQDGPQTKPFDRIILRGGLSTDVGDLTVTEGKEKILDNLGYGKDGDRELVHAILDFTRLLLEHCGNRSLYSSSDRLGAILNTTNLPLISLTLRLAVRLAQRYHASRQRGPNANQHLHNALLASHYNIDLDKVQHLANPFARTSPNSSHDPPQLSEKGKSKDSAAEHTRADMLSLATEGSLLPLMPQHELEGRSRHSLSSIPWEEWGTVQVRYYERSGQEETTKKETPPSVSKVTPSLQTPNRRPSALSRQVHISDHENSANDADSSAPSQQHQTTSSGLRVLELRNDTLRTQTTDEILRAHLSTVPKEVSYELLTKVRVASAMTNSAATRQQLLGIRLLAITNLAYIYPEQLFQQKIIQPDSEEPRRLQLIYQIADLIHAPGNGRPGAPKWLQTLGIEALQALAKLKSKGPDVCSALGTNVNHGAIMYLLRLTVTSITAENNEQDESDWREWREALFSLLETLPSAAPRTGDSLIGAGLFEPLVEMLNLRTTKAEQIHATVVAFLNNMIYQVRDSMQALATAKGFDAVADLIGFEVDTSLRTVSDGHGIPQEHKSQAIDYEIQYYHQQTLRWLLKFINHMMSHGNGQFERILRNLIDSPQLLNGLRTVLSKPKLYGSTIWSNAVNIVSSFIHNEPTSYAIIAEAGLTRGFLECITAESIVDPSQKPDKSDDPMTTFIAGHATRSDDLEALYAQLRTYVDTKVSEGDDGSPSKPLAEGILPATETIMTIPQAFGAICLNNAGMDIFLHSTALGRFFECFQSPKHVKAMDAETDLPRILGTSFDELVRHHPRLRNVVLGSVFVMLNHVMALCRDRTLNKGGGTELFFEEQASSIAPTETLEQQTSDSNGLESQVGPSSDIQGNSDVVMRDAPPLSPIKTKNSEVPTSSTAKAPEFVDEPDMTTYMNTALKFLAGLFENHSLCASFVELGGLTIVLDFIGLKTLQYDFNNQAASQELSHVIRTLAEQKPHVVMPALGKATMSTIEEISVMFDPPQGNSHFLPYVAVGSQLSSKDARQGSDLVRGLIKLHALCNILFEAYAPAPYQSRSSPAIFSAVNLWDLYPRLLEGLMEVHSTCVWEEILLSKVIPDSWKSATKIKGYGMGSEEADSVFGFTDNPTNSPELVSNGTTHSPQANAANSSSEDATPTRSSVKRESQTPPVDSPYFKNAKVLRYLLSQVPSAVIPLVQNIGKSFTSSRRRLDSYTRQRAVSTADAWASSAIAQLNSHARVQSAQLENKFAYWVVMLTSISQLMVEGSFDGSPSPQCVTLLLQAFKDVGGFDIMSTIFDGTFEYVCKPIDEVRDQKAHASAQGALRIILGFFAQIVAHKTITEAKQTQDLVAIDSQRGQSTQFNDAQLLVELRMAVLPAVRRVWESEYLEKAMTATTRCVIDTLKSILGAIHEQGAKQRGNHQARANQKPPKVFSLNRSNVDMLVSKGHSADLAREALYRCANAITPAEDYCRTYRVLGLDRNPIPPSDQEQPRRSPAAEAQNSTTSAIQPSNSDVAQTTTALGTQTTANEGALATGPLPGIDELGLPNPLPQNLQEITEANIRDGSNGISPAIENLLSMSIDQLNPSDVERAEVPPPEPEESTETNDSKAVEPGKSKEKEQETKKFPLDILNEERISLRGTIIDRALDVLNVHDDLTFDLADLIDAAAKTAADGATLRKEIGETLVQSLVSLQTDEDLDAIEGRKIAAYAHLLALVIHKDEFYEATLEHVKANYDTLLTFIKISTTQPQTKGYPWIAQILLVLEKAFAQDERPQKLQWRAPMGHDLKIVEPMVVDEPSNISFDGKSKMFDSLMEILPRISKEENLALSVVRMLIVLTRRRPFAMKLGEKLNIQRLFVMIKQLAGITNNKLQGSFMTLLRNIVEDEAIIRHKMRTAVLESFEERLGRTVDTSNYVKSHSALVLRSPVTFVEVTNDLLEIPHYDSNSSTQQLAIKEPILEAGNIDKPNGINASIDDLSEPRPDEENTEIEATDKSPKKSKSSDGRHPTVENPSGVIHYLLCELLSYKDVDDKEPNSAVRTLSQDSQQPTTSEHSAAVDNPANGASPDASSSTKTEKSEFKADQHPIHVYRCFILQCLTELLMSYNQMKIEFINFSRSVDAKPMTPSKPRPGVLSYLLKDLIPLGTLNPEESVDFRKKTSIGHWAMITVVALCQSTNEPSNTRKTRSLKDDEADLDLTYVRRFVLEICLKAYKDATASSDDLDSKYSRLLHLAQLLSCILSGKLTGIRSNPNGAETYNDTQQSIAKIMFEKNYIPALTASIADMDLNFPGSSRAVKYILRPLKQLTQTALALSESDNLPTNPLPTEDDVLSVASSVSGADAEREQTPDLFRNSALGMFEPRHEDLSSSESSQEDDEMYDEEYDEGMDYEEEMEPDNDEVVSDEEEDIDGAGPIEGLPGDSAMDVEVVVDDDEDEEEETSTEEDEDDDGDSDDMDVDEESEVIDEVTGDDENASLDDGDDDGWHDEDGEEDGDDETSEVDDQYTGGAEGDMGFHGHVSAIQDLMAGFGQPNPEIADTEQGDGDEDIETMEEMAGDEDDEDEGDEDDINDGDGEPLETELVFGDPEMSGEGSETPWLFDDEEDSLPMPRSHHHHHHPRRLHSPWNAITSHTSAPHMYRSSRTPGPGQPADDGVNPLLRSHDQTSIPPRSEGDTLSRITIRPNADWRIGPEDGILPSMGPRDDHVSLFENILSTIGQSGSGIPSLSGMHGALSYYISGNGSRGGLRSLQALLGSRPPRYEGPRDIRTNSGSAQATFVPASTTLRWQEQSRILFQNDHLNVANRILNALMQHLVPPAVEREKLRRAEEDKRQQELKALEEKREEERIAKEKVERDEEEARQKFEREAAAEAEAEAARERAEDVGSPERQDHESLPAADEMEGLEATDQPQETPAAVEDAGDEAAESASAMTEERVRATIRGRELDITGMGVDLEYLNALPEDLREEVLMGQLADQRSQAAAAGEEPSDISREFLDALPPEIREELLQQEAADRRRRERQEATRQAAVSSAPNAGRPEEMDNASFFATLEPNLRQAILADQNEEMLGQLPETLAAEARALGADRPMHRFGGIGGLRRHGEPESGEREARRSRAQKPPRRQIVQMLDKAGVATLLRLMFVPQHGSSRQTLNDILHAVSQNRQNRAEIVGMLLSILHDGSTDVNAIEKSFTSLSIRAKQPPSSVQKTPQPLKRSLTNQTSPFNGSDMTPLMVIQQCLGALVSLTQYNLHIPSYFLTENDSPHGFKPKATKKGKSKETKASRFAINALLSLLDRKLIIESSSCTEQLSALLQIVTHPLTLLHRPERTLQGPKEDHALVETSQPTEAVPNENPQPAEEMQTSEAEAEANTNTESQNVSTADQTATGTSTENQAVGGTTSSGEHDPSTVEVSKEAGPKKTKTLTPPEIPEENLRLVVNVLAARECSSKTFRDTLSTINNLSAIPQARETFGKGLVGQAERLGKVIFDDLSELVNEAKTEKSTEADFQALALAKFSPASSDQAKLLRVLSALDYLFDPKRSSVLASDQDSREAEAVQSGSTDPGAGTPESLKQDLVTTLYEHPTFGALWIKLSEYLVAIRQREGMIGIATILLPLIESLMVVCKNTTSKDVSIKAGKEVQMSTPPPDSDIDSLFFRFTEEHRKVLNELVRNNPKLMSGTFSLLVKNPNVLEFDNKRSYFTRRLHARGTDVRHSQPPLQLNIRRDQVFLDSFKALTFRTGDEIKYGKLNIRFHGEEGVDAGGVTREWFQVLSRQMFNPDYALFVPVASDRTTFHPNKNSYFNEEHLVFFKFIGRIIGKALYEGRPLDCHFSRAVYKRILGRTVSIKDMETLDLDYYKSLVWMLENDITEVIQETFSIETEDFGAKQTVDLIENGRNIPVTEENKQEYAQLVVEYRLTGSVQSQLEHFLKGKLFALHFMFLLTNLS